MEIALIIVMVVMVGGMMFFSGRKNKKSQENYVDMLNSLEKGDKVYLTSRIVGKVIKVIDEGDGMKYVLVESGEGENKSNFLVDVQAVYSVLAKANTPVEKKDEVSSEEPAQENVETEPVIETEEEKKD